VGTLDCLVVSEWPGNSDAVWEHPGHLRAWRFIGSLTRAVRFDRSGVGSSDPSSGDLGDVEAWADDGMAVLGAVGCDRVAVVVRVRVPRSPSRSR
jgi:pimeloyl-ACP methyl ester carboxylesterase